MKLHPVLLQALNYIYLDYAYRYNSYHYSILLYYSKVITHTSITGIMTTEASSLLYPKQDIWNTIIKTLDAVNVFDQRMVIEPKAVLQPIMQCFPELK